MARNATREGDTEAVETQRLDKWLWFARVAKTRTLAASLVSDGRVRLNRTRVTKPAQTVREGDVVTVSVARGVRVLKILAPGSRRGPASEAAGLYEEIVPIASRSAPAEGQPVASQGEGRPTKKDRRVMDKLRSRELD